MKERRRWGRVLLFVFFAILLALPVVLYVRVRIAEAAWGRSFGSLDSLPDRFHGELNETTEMIPEWIALLGLASGGPGALIPLNPPPPDVLTAVRDYGWPYASTSPTPAAPAAAVEQYVLSRADVFSGIAQWMDAHPSPSWPVKLKELRGAPPNFLTLMQLQRMILAAALVREWRGDHRGGERLLAASWKLNESLRDRPELFAQLVALYVFRVQCVAIRKMAVDPVVWQRRLSQHDYRASVATAWQAETYRKMREVKINIYADPTYIAEIRALNVSLGDESTGFFGDRPRSLELLITPLRWFDLPALLEGSRQVLLAARNVPIDENFDLKADYDRGFSKWLYIPDRDVQPWNVNAFTRVDRAVAEGELTAKVLIARAARAANGGRWPISIAGFEASRIANGRWIYEASPRGVTIRFSREVRWPKALLGPSVPLRYTTDSGS